MVRNRSVRSIGFVLLVGVVLTVPVFGQAPTGRSAEVEEPAWLSYERGMQEFRKGNYGQALFLFRTALETQPVYPEATAAIGRVYRQDQNTALAERFLRDALEQSNQLYVPEEKYRIAYDLAELYSLTGRRKEFLDITTLVLDDHRLSDEGREGTALVDSYMRILQEDGIDRLLTLYRLPMDFAYQAYAESGILYVRTGRYNDAVRNLSVAAIQGISTIVAHIRRWELDFEYVALEGLLARIPADEVLAEFVRESDLYAVTYYLASALYGNRATASAFRIWEALSETEAAGEYRRRSRLQLRSPELEPVIDY